MNKKGFTLVELLAIIAVLSIIILVSTASLTDTVKKNNELAYQSNIEDIKLAAQSFNSVNNGRVVQVSVSDLKKERYITNNIVNPLDNSIMDGCVYIINGNYVYQEHTCTTIFNN